MRSHRDGCDNPSDSDEALCSPAATWSGAATGLIERLERGTASKVTLVSAPAGFGKTTLLADWLAPGTAASADERSAAWLSLDRGDNDPASFWTYLITALQTVAPGVGADMLTLLQEPQPPPIEAVLSRLLNDLGAIARDIVLVIHDYHVIEEREVQDGIGFLLDHLPPQLHLVIASRADPVLPLARLRVRGELVETRAAELRFTLEEAAAYLNQTMGLVLSAQDVAALEARTEGWVAALQLAALSIQGRDDVAGFIAGFAGDDRYILDYLAEEVLRRQPEHVQSFLLQTSILDRLSGPLCDAVTGHGGGKAMLEALERGNMFLVPLDDRRRWYRYHHLFADVLQVRLLDERQHDVADLHRRASEWYEQNGEQSVAIRHALSAEDFERTADLIEVAIPAMRRGRQEATVRGWVEALPDDLIGTGRCSASTMPGHCCSVASSRALSRAYGTPSGGCTRRQTSAKDRRRQRLRWSWRPRRNFAGYRVGSPSTVPRRPRRRAMWPPL